jgi:hypothetical protein
VEYQCYQLHTKCYPAFVCHTIGDHCGSFDNSGSLWGPAENNSRKNNIHTLQSVDKGRYYLLVETEELRHPQVGLLVTSLFTIGDIGGAWLLSRSHRLLFPAPEPPFDVCCVRRSTDSWYNAHSDRLLFSTFLLLPTGALAVFESLTPPFKLPLILLLLVLLLLLLLKPFAICSSWVIIPRSTRGLTGEKGGAAAGGGGGVGPPKVYPEENSESATAKRKNKNQMFTIKCRAMVHSSPIEWAHCYHHIPH